MAEIIRGDNTKGIKSIGELALRISRFDSYRLFTLYEDVIEKKVMNVSGNQKYYLVFRSPKKEIRIPEYDPKGFFEVDKVNGCILFKITKKNAEDILSMKTGGDKIFHIVRVFEERDSFGRVLSVTDEVEVYNGKWGDDADFNTFTTEMKVDLLTKALAMQVEKNTKLFNEYEDLVKRNNEMTKEIENLKSELLSLRSENDSLNIKLASFEANTVDGSIVSTNVQYHIYENGIEYTEDQYNEMMQNGSKNFTINKTTDVDESKTTTSGTVSR